MGDKRTKEYPTHPSPPINIKRKDLQHSSAPKKRKRKKCLDTGMESLEWEKFLTGTPGIREQEKYEVLSMSSLYFGPKSLFL
jgi:hypothetical protein